MTTDNPLTIFATPYTPKLGGNRDKESPVVVHVLPPTRAQFAALAEVKGFDEMEKAVRPLVLSVDGVDVDAFMDVPVLVKEVADFATLGLMGMGDAQGNG